MKGEKMRFSILAGLSGACVGLAISGFNASLFWMMAVVFGLQSIHVAIESAVESLRKK